MMEGRTKKKKKKKKKKKNKERMSSCVDNKCQKETKTVR
jgi:hypothetical protein